MLCSSFQAFNV